MGKNIITCPKCKEKLTIDVDPKKEKFAVKCPICDNTFTVALRKKEVKIPTTATVADSSMYGMHKSDSSDTLSALDIMKGEPVLIFEGVTYPLQIGRNTIGRKSTQGMATIQLPSNDRYMSRVNAVINVTKVADETFSAVLNSANERNLARVNGKEIKMEDRIILLNGYILTLGNSQVLFSLKQN